MFLRSHIAQQNDQVSISPTFYEQLLRQNPFAKKIQTHIKAVQKNFGTKKLLIKYW